MDPIIRNVSKARRTFLSLSLSLVLFYFPRTRGRQKRRFLPLLRRFLLSSLSKLSRVFTTRSRKSRFCDRTCSDLLRPLLTHTLRTHKQTVILVIKRVPINKHLVVEIPNNSSLLGATTVSAMATSATKNPPY